MNIKNYKIKKEQGIATIVKAGGGYACFVKRFSEHDGSEIDVDVESVSIDKLSGMMEKLISDAKSTASAKEHYEKLYEENTANS